MDFLDKYNEINNSFKNKCIFKVGESQGVFSEINNMIYAMLYCLENKIQFVLTSTNANFAPEKGWEEFFLPFCKQDANKFHAKKYNVRFKEQLRKSLRRRFKVFVYKIFHRTKLTQDIFNKVYPEYADKYVNIPELNWHGRTYEIIKPLAELVWRFNPETRSEINEIIKNFNLPEKYVAIQMRRGDKVTIYNGITASADKYMTELKKITDIRDILLLCDEYDDVKYLVDNYKDYNFYTICQPNEHGYSNEDFQKQDWSKKRKRTVELFATIDAMLKAKLFLGTEIANPQLFIKMFLDQNKFYLIENYI